MTDHLIGFPARATTVAIIIVMIGIERNGVATSEAGRRAACGEEDLVGSLTDVIVVEAFEVREGALEVGSRLVGEVETARKVVVAGGSGG